MNNEIENSQPQSLNDEIRLSDRMRLFVAMCYLSGALQGPINHAVSMGKEYVREHRHENNPTIMVSNDSEDRLARLAHERQDEYFDERAHPD